jgi:hypothetical protein
MKDSWALMQWLGNWFNYNAACRGPAKNMVPPGESFVVEAAFDLNQLARDLAKEL